MDAWQAAVLAVLALLVGALLPALVQLTLVLRDLRVTVTRAGPALVALTATAQRLERLTAKVEEGGQLDHALEAIDSLSGTVARLQETARLAAAVGASVVPAVVAAVKAWRAPGEEGAATPGPAGAEAPP
jgi:hypothetical protein